MVTWVLYLCIGVLIGGMAGFYFAKMDDLSKKQKKALEDKLKQSEQELLDYKDQVTGHFRETAALVNQMTESYQKVHEHLSAGASLLCNTELEVNQIDVGPKLGSDIAAESTKSESDNTENTATQNENLDTEPLTPKERPKELQKDQQSQNQLKQHDDNSAIDQINQNPEIEPLENTSGTSPVLPEASALTDDIEAPKTSSISGDNKSKSTTSDNNPEASSTTSEEDRSQLAKGASASGNPNSSSNSKPSSTAVEKKQRESNHSQQSSTAVPDTDAQNATTEPNIYETMAVAEDFAEDSNSSDDLPTAPGSRMVH